MPAPPDPADTPFVRRLRRDTPLVAAELRPPPADLSGTDSMDSWIDLHHAMRRLSRRSTPVFLTDDAVGEREEQNLRHLTTNLAGELDASIMAPFLTCKHSLEYCLMYAARAASAGVQAMVVVGGDTSVGPPRCVDHAYQLRRRIRDRVPGLSLGGWANPHRDAAEQVGYLLEDDFTGEFYLTQVVSHHQLDRVEAFLEEARRRDLPWPGVFGVFYYRSANPETLQKLSRFFPVPAEEITREFERGDAPEEICARTVRALRELGVERIYLSNLGFRRAPDRLERVLEVLDDGS
jgi:hypothetical protein